MKGFTVNIGKYAMHFPTTGGSKLANCLLTTNNYDIFNPLRLGQQSYSYLFTGINFSFSVMHVCGMVLIGLIL